MLQTERLDHKDQAVATSIHRILALAYAQEAQLLQIQNGGEFERTPEEMRESDQVFIGASRGGVLLGLVSLGQDEEPNQICISVLVVHPEHQRQGIARALLVYTLAQSEGAVFSVVAATSNLPAQALYRSLGFVEYRRGTMGANALEVVKLRARSNPSLKRTRTGMPLQAVISFSALRVLPARAA